MRTCFAMLLILISFSASADTPAPPAVQITPLLESPAPEVADSTAASVPAASTPAPAGGESAPVVAPSQTVAPSPTGAPLQAAAPLQAVAQGERAELEAFKQILQLRLEVATLLKKLEEVELGVRAAPAAATPRAAKPAEPPPRVVARHGFDGRYRAVLRMTTGGELTVEPGDQLPAGKVEMIDAQGVTAIWHGKRLRLLDVGPAAGNADTRAGELDLTLPAPPAAIGGQ